MATERVGIIGAGISGIAHADVLTRLGYQVTLFERAARLGGVWAHSYPGVSLQNSALQYRVSSKPWHGDNERHPTGAEILTYLNELVQERGFDLRLEHEVVSAREAEGGGWQLQVRGPAGEVQAERFDRLVVSVGQYTEGKHRPSFPGQEQFTGAVLTERDVHDLARFDGKRVVVLGFGKSALDMATAAAKRAAAVHHVFRTPRWTIPRWIFGVHYTRLLFNRFGSVMMPAWTHPTAVERALHRQRFVIDGFWSGLRALFAFIARRQAGPAGAERVAKVLPTHPLVPDLRSAAALAPDDYYGLIGSGAIEPHQAEIAAFTPAGVRLSDGTELDADVVVLSVGSEPPRFPFLSDAHRALLESEPDGVQLYRHVVHPRIPTLAFAGFNHGFMHVPAAELGALWLAATWRGELELPPVDEMERAVEHIRDWKRANTTFEPSRSCAVSTRYQQYLDVVLQDLGLSPYRKLPNVVAEVFARYGADDYAGVVDEYLRRGPRAPRRPVPLPT